jgi:hypothetical protein
MAFSLGSVEGSTKQQDKSYFCTLLLKVTRFSICEAEPEKSSAQISGSSHRAKDQGWDIL